MVPFGALGLRIGGSEVWSEAFEVRRIRLFLIRLLVDT